MGKNDEDPWELIKLWIIWIIAGIIIFTVLGLWSNDGDNEEVPDYCDTAICK